MLMLRFLFQSLTSPRPSPKKKKKKTSPAGFAPGRKYTRYRGPYLDQLSLESLKAEPKKWSEFFGVERWTGGGTTRRRRKEKTDADADSDKKPSSSSSSSSSSPPPPPPPSWTLPTSVLALRERAEENVVAFLPNYLRAVAALVVALASLGGRPLSLVGLACLAAFAVSNARGTLGGPSVAETIARKQQQLILEQQRAAAAAGGGQQAPQGASAAPLPPADEPTPPARAAATVFVYGVAAYTRAFAPLTRGIALGIALAALHASLRVAATERAAAWTTAAAAATAAAAPSSGEQRQTRVSLPYSVAGVPFRDVLFGGASSSPSSPSEDPRRCLRELAAAARALASAAAIGAKTGAVAAFDAAVAKAKALRQQLR